MRSLNPLGFVIEPQGTIKRQTLKIEGDVVWGDDDKKNGRPAWLRPLKMFRAKNRAFVLLATHQLSPVANPGEDTTEIDRARLSRVMRQQYDKTMGANKPLDAQSLQMWIMWALMILTVGLVLLALLTGGTSYISEKLRGEEPIARISHVFRSDV